MPLSQSQVTQFQNLIWDYYRKYGRDLPWRNTTNPYNIFVSEVMLQQTQVSRVIPKYLSFIKEFPDMTTLARAPLASVLRVWSGLGYNRRARFLWESAQILVNKYKGIVPKDSELVDELPGIGSTTACSILVFSYNLPLIFIETNIRRVFIHYLQGLAFSSKKGQAFIEDKMLIPHITQTLDRSNPREWYYALMDYGAFLGKEIENPNTKSAHYTKQSKFEGSTRQVRGKILKLLIEKKSLTKEGLVKQLPKTNLDLDKIISSLQVDRLIKINNKMISLHS